MSIIKKGFYLLLITIAVSACDRIKYPESGSRLIKQSNQIVVDNVNGRMSDGVIQSINFFYNENNTLNSATVYDDTSVSAILLKSLAFEYQPDKIVVNTYDAIAGSSKAYFYYNEKNQVTNILDTLGNGLWISYENDLITRIYDSSSLLIRDFVNFVYDNNNNLLQFELKLNNGPVVGRAILSYDNKPISPELDTRFFSAGVRFIYIGGLDLISKVGLNFGKTNTNRLIKREEYNLTENELIETYDFGYIYDSQNRIVKRNMRWSSDTLFYQFKY